eukprot:4855729-Pyramimonas_sp.AAC.1
MLSRRGNVMSRVPGGVRGRQPGGDVEERQRRSARFGTKGPPPRGPSSGKFGEIAPPSDPIGGRPPCTNRGVPFGAGVAS